MPVKTAKLWYSANVVEYEQMLVNSIITTIDSCHQTHKFYSALCVGSDVIGRLCFPLSRTEGFRQSLWRVTQSSSELVRLAFGCSLATTRVTPGNFTWDCDYTIGLHALISKTISDLCCVTYQRRSRLIIIIFTLISKTISDLCGVTYQRRSRLIMIIFTFLAITSALGAK